MSATVPSIFPMCFVPFSHAQSPTAHHVLKCDDRFDQEAVGPGSKAMDGPSIRRVGGLVAPSVLTRSCGVWCTGGSSITRIDILVNLIFDIKFWDRSNTTVPQGIYSRSGLQMGLFRYYASYI